jgi:predicted RNA polymerase sigma factor
MRILPTAEAPGPESKPRRLTALAELLSQTTRPGRATPCRQLEDVDLPIIASHPALAKDSQRILLLRCALWFEPPEIGRITGLSAVSVDTRLRTAYRRLRSVGLGEPLLSDSRLERTLCCLDLLEELYWRAAEMTGTDGELSLRLHDAVVQRTKALAFQNGAVGAEAKALLAFLALASAPLRGEGPRRQDGWLHLRAAEQEGASGRYLWLARIQAAYLSADTATTDWRSIARMWERVHEMERPSIRHWIGRSRNRTGAENLTVPMDTRVISTR